MSFTVKEVWTIGKKLCLRSWVSLHSRLAVHSFFLCKATYSRAVQNFFFISFLWNSSFQFRTSFSLFSSGLHLQIIIGKVLVVSNIHHVENNTWACGDMEFPFKCSIWDLNHDNRNFIFPSNNVLFCIICSIVYKSFLQLLNIFLKLCSPFAILCNSGVTWVVTDQLSMCCGP